MVHSQLEWGALQRQQIHFHTRPPNPPAHGDRRPQRYHSAHGDLEVFNAPALGLASCGTSGRSWYDDAAHASCTDAPKLPEFAGKCAVEQPPQGASVDASVVSKESRQVREVCLTDRGCN